MFVVIVDDEVVCYYEEKSLADSTAQFLKGSVQEVRKGQGQFFWWEGSQLENQPFRTWRECRAFDEYPGERFHRERVGDRILHTSAVAYTEERVREILKNGGL